MIDFLYKVLDLPPFPDHLKPDFEEIKNRKTDWVAEPRSATRNGEVIVNSLYDRFTVSDEITQWVRDNISSDFCNVGLSFLHRGTINLPHRDFTRDFTLTWIFETGGEDVRTIWWQQQGHELLREPGTYPTTWDDLEYLDHAVLKPGKWSLLNASCLHSIEGLTGPRISLQVGFKWGSAWIDQFRSIG